MRHRSKDLMINELFLATGSPMKKKKNNPPPQNPQQTPPHTQTNKPTQNQANKQKATPQKPQEFD